MNTRRISVLLDGRPITIDGISGCKTIPLGLGQHEFVAKAESWTGTVVESRATATVVDRRPTPDRGKVDPIFQEDQDQHEIANFDGLSTKFKETNSKKKNSDIYSVTISQGGADYEVDIEGDVTLEKVYKAHATIAANRYGINPNVFLNLVWQESKFNPKAISKAGALGLTQIMPGTSIELGVRDVTNPVEQIVAGARYLKQHLEAFGGEYRKALAAYKLDTCDISLPKWEKHQTEVKEFVFSVLSKSAQDEEVSLIKFVQSLSKKPRAKTRKPVRKIINYLGSDHIVEFDTIPTEYDLLDATIILAATRNGLDPKLFKNLVWQESNFNNRAISKAGARGLTLLMPDTAKQLGVRNIEDPVEQLDAAARRLKQILDAQAGNYEKALALYKASNLPIGGAPSKERKINNFVRQILIRTEVDKNFDQR